MLAHQCLKLTPSCPWFAGQCFVRQDRCIGVCRFGVFVSGFVSPFGRQYFRCATSGKYFLNLSRYLLVWFDHADSFSKLATSLPVRTCWYSVILAGFSIFSAHTTITIYVLQAVCAMTFSSCPYTCWVINIEAIKNPFALSKLCYCIAYKLIQGSWETDIAHYSTLSYVP